MSLNHFERQQIEHEITWLKDKIEALKPKAARKPSAVREMNDLQRQVREREISLAFDARAGRA